MSINTFCFIINGLQFSWHEPLTYRIVDKIQANTIAYLFSWTRIEGISLLISNLNGLNLSMVVEG